MRPENPLLRFEGLSIPSTDFQAVRDGRRSALMKYEVDLSSARSLAANSALFLDIAGNSLFIDQASDVGTATIVFQEDDNVQPAKVFVQPGFIASVPFTRLIIENSAQSAKVLRIFYGVDIDFRPGMSATVSGSVNATLVAPIAYGVSPITITDTGPLPGANYKSNTALALNTPETVFTPAANANGAILWAASSHTYQNAFALVSGAFVAKSSAPANVLDGTVLMYEDGFASNYGANRSTWGRLTRPIRIAPGLGLYFLDSQGQTAALRTATYTLL